MTGGRRPTAFERRRRQARVIAVVVALAMLLLVTVPLLAYGDEREVPPQAVEVLGTGATGARTVWMWSTPFLEGDRAASPVVSSEQWVGTTTVGASAVGTVTAWRDPETDRIVLASTSDDVVLATALSTLDADALLVTDRGEWLVVSGGTVRSLLADPLSSMPTPRPLPDVQSERAEQYAQDLAAAAAGADDTVGGGTSGTDKVTPADDVAARPWWKPGGTALVAALLAVVVAVAADLVRRRRAVA